MEISHPTGMLKGTIDLPFSKSLVNRLLVLNNLYGEGDLKWIQSESRDSVIMKGELEKLKNQAGSKQTVVLDVKDAGTCLRFLTAVACITPGKWLIMGTPRLLERPIDSYLDSLRNIGFDVRSSAKGLQISGIDPSLIHCADWEVDLSETSQFATALLLIAPAFKSKINLTLAGKAVSSSYLQLTVDCLQQCGWDVHNETSSIVINSKEPVFVIPQNLVEPDWSSAAYFFAMALLSDSAQLFFPSLISSSNQPDSSIMDTFTQFGGLIHEDAGGMHISMNAACRQVPNQFTKDYTNQPDLAMTEIVLMHALKVPMHISGVQHLKHKESDRLAALKSMLSVWEKRGQNLACFETFSDHRMAMSLSLFALKENISIENPEVVHKSFPKFWKEMEKIGFILKDV